MAIAGAVRLALSVMSILPGGFAGARLGYDAAVRAAQPMTFERGVQVPVEAGTWIILMESSVDAVCRTDTDPPSAIEISLAAVVEVEHDGTVLRSRLEVSAPGPGTISVECAGEGRSVIAPLDLTCADTGLAIGLAVPMLGAAAGLLLLVIGLVIRRRPRAP